MFCSFSMYWGPMRMRLGLRLANGALVIQHLPAGSSSAPERGAARDALSLMQGVGNQIVVRGNLPALKIARQPCGFIRVRCAILQRVQHELAAVAPARGAHFPEIRIGHGLVVLARGAEFGMVKDRLA